MHNVIGNKGGIPWHIPEDLEYFRKLTTYNIVIMGRKTFQSLGRRLKDRLNIVVSGRIAPLTMRVASSDTVFVSSIKDAVDISHEVRQPDQEIFVIGGQSIYEQMLQYADTVFLTRIRTSEHGDTHFPILKSTDWYFDNVCEAHLKLSRTGIHYSFEIYKRTICQKTLSVTSVK
jgi:dihydrofolate reductase